MSEMAVNLIEPDDLENRLVALGAYLGARDFPEAVRKIISERLSECISDGVSLVDVSACGAGNGIAFRFTFDIAKIIAAIEALWVEVAHLNSSTLGCDDSIVEEAGAVVRAASATQGGDA